MKKVVLNCVIAMLWCGTALAKNPKALFNSTDSAALSYSASFGSKCDPSTCTGNLKANLSFSQTIVVPDGTLAVIDGSTTFSVTVLSTTLIFLPSEDPDFQSGDTSFQIVRPVPFLEPDLFPTEVSVSAKWGKGALTVSIKANQAASGPGLVIPARINESIKAAKTPKEVPVFEVSTVLENTGDGTIVNAPASLRCSIKQAGKFAITAEGSSSGVEQSSIKSKDLLPEV